MQPRPDTAMIFGAGLGLRMRPITNTIPKPLVQINGKPIIEYSLGKLKEFGIKRIVVNTHYLFEKLEDYLKTYDGVEIITIFEEELLNTGGGIVNAKETLGDKPFFVINGDIIWHDGEVNLLEKVTESFVDCDALLVLKKVEEANGYNGNGDFDLTEEGYLKISNNDKKTYVFTGVQILNPELLKNKDVEPFSIIDIYKENIDQNGVLHGVKGIELEGEWFHIGTPEAIDSTAELLCHSEQSEESFSSG